MHQRGKLLLCTLKAHQKRVKKINTDISVVYLFSFVI